MYISKINIHNFRNLKKFNLNFNSGLSIIIGENNIGKSNLLDSLNLIFNSNYSVSPYSNNAYKQSGTSGTIDVSIEGGASLC